MATEKRKIQLGVAVDASGAKAGFQEVKDAARDMATSVTQAGQTASKGIDGMGDGSAGAAAKVERATANLVGSIQRATAAAEAGRKSGADFFESLAKQRNIPTDAIKPYLDRLRQVEEQTKKATAAATDFSRVTSSLGATGFVKPLGNPTTSLGATTFGAAAIGDPGTATAAAAERAAQSVKRAGVEFDKYGMSVKQTQAALRGLPAQFTDIAVGLQSGQNPLTVLLQQGGQLKDMFGGIGPAAKAMGGYVMGLLSPLTLAAGAVATLGFAYYKGSKETDDFRKALVLSNNAVGASVGQLSAMARSISEVAGTQGAAAAALTAIVNAGGVSVGNLEKFATTALRLQRTIGTSVEDTAKAFASLADEPLKASEKLNQSMNYLTLSVYDQIRALEEQGRKTEAAAAAQKAYDSALDRSVKLLEDNKGTIERIVQTITDGAKGMWDALLGVGRKASPQIELQSAQSALDLLEKRYKDRVSRGMATGDVLPQLEAARARVQAQEESIRLANSQTAREAEQVRLQKEGVEARKANAKWAEASLSAQQKTNKALKEYRDNNARIVAAGGVLDPKQVAAEETAIRKSFAGPAAAKPRAFQDDAATKMLQSLREQEASLKSQLETDEKLTASEKERAKFVQLIADLKDKKQLTAEQKSLLANQETIKAQLDQNVGIERQIVLKKEAQKLDEQRKKDADDFARQIEAINASIASSSESRAEQQQRSLDAFGLGDRARQQVEAQRSIRAEFERYRRQLDRSAADKGQLGSDAYKAEVDQIKRSLNDALNAQSDYFARVEEKQRDWANGATAAIANYADEANNIAKQIDEAFTNAFKGMEDALVSFVTTGKLDFKSFADSLIADITRIIIKQQIMAPLMQSLGIGGAGTGLIGGFLGSLFGGGTGGTIDALGDGVWANAKGNVFHSAGLSAYSGTIVNRPTLFPFAKGMGLMGEAGPEAILPLKRGADGKLGVEAGSGQQARPVNINFSVQGPVDRRSEATIARAVTQKLQSAQRWV